MGKIERTGRFTDEMWAWFARHKRILPWRDLTEADDTHRAYLVLVSEIMLQQTQVSRVMIIFKQFIERFPTLTALAKASNKDVILAWKGMGYNSRALRLRDAAKEIVDTHGGVFPNDYDALIAIKGVGPYTAGAIRNFAFGLPTPCVDTNIHRILHRVFVGPEPEKEDGAVRKRVLGLAGETLSITLDVPESKKPSRSPASSGAIPRDTANWHASLMDFGSLVCKKSSPRCEACPMAQGICKSAFKVKDVAKRRARARGKMSTTPTEPGRVIAGKFVPNRIIRGRIVEVLREAKSPMTPNAIGVHVAPDWNDGEHRAWLDAILAKLIADQLLVATRGRYALRD